MYIIQEQITNLYYLYIFEYLINKHYNFYKDKNKYNIK